MRTKLFLTACLFLFGISALFAQQSALTDQLQRFGAKNPQEKVYLHLDKPHYIAGDNIWLKGYISLGPQNQLSALSNTLHVDLVDPGNKVVSTINLLILHGVAMGNIHLNDTIQQGTYHIRAYTNWMRNLPQESFFNKAITVGRPQIDPALVQTTFAYDESDKQLKATVNLVGHGAQFSKVPLKYNISFDGKSSASGTATTGANGDVIINFNNQKNLDLSKGVLAISFANGGEPVTQAIAVNIRRPENTTSFMPEGGDLVMGIQSRIAFKMLQPDGLAATGTGCITDETGATIVDFTSGFAGMGSFFFTPEQGKTYKVTITYANGKKQTLNLPPVLAQGYTLTVMPHMPAYVFFAVRASASLVKNQKMTLLVQRQGRVIYTAQATLNNAETLVKLPMTNVPSGLIQVTLFDENTKPVCERLFFNINKNTALPLAADIGDSFAPRKQVTVNLKAGTDADSLRAGSFSASIVNLGGLPPLKSNQSGILPGLLLNPELKGFVENPDHYFESAEGMPDAGHLTELDNLVLCQGWRRIVWDDVKAGNWAKPVYQPEKSFSVTGTITHNNGNPAPNAKVSLMSTKSFSAMDTLSDAKGHFIFDHLLLKDSMRLALQAKDVKDRNTLLIKADPQPGIKSMPPFTDIQFNEDASYQAYLKKAYADMPDSIKLKLVGYRALKEVKITAVKTKKDLVPSISANLNGPGKADEVFLADEMQNSSDLYHFLDGRALGIMFTVDAMTKEATPYLSRTARSSLAGNRPAAMKIYYDGVLMNEGTGFNIDDIPINNIASVEILRSTVYSALYDTNEGVIIITGKTADIRAEEIKAAPGYLPLMLQGYQTPRQFYAPDYTVTANAPADHRTTVYWKPDIVTDKQGNASFKFFTTDDKGTYRICIEGMTADGRPAHLVREIKVE